MAASCTILRVAAPVRPDPAIRAWKPPVPGIREVLHARFVEHAYPPHAHDVWTLFIVDDGAIRYDLHRRARAADPAMVSVLPPHIVHDGRPALAGGYRKRVLYLEEDVLGGALIGRAVDEPVLGDASLRSAVCAVHDALACPDDALEAETRFHLVVERIRAALGADAGDPSPAPRDDLADALRALLDERLFEPVTLAEAAERLDTPPARLARAFVRTFGIPPHRYVLTRRLEAARERILAGQPLADVAAEVGFADQAHLTHRFRWFLGTTPGRFARG